jgi:CheY-like chemotaxis protein
MFADHGTLEVCEEAVNGLEAVEKARQCKPDLVILDFSMPVMNGLEAAKIIHAEMPDVPIILFTQHAALINHSGVHYSGITRVVSKDDMFRLPEHAVDVLQAA